MKIHILYNFEEGFVGGGGNQFLKALKEEWLSLGVYENDIKKADVILFNSHNQLKQVFCLKRKLELFKSFMGLLVSKRYYWIF